MRDLTRDPSMMFVQDQPQTFLDNIMLYRFGAVSRRWYQPAHRPDLPVIRKDKPWEHITYFTYSN